MNALHRDLDSLFSPLLPELGSPNLGKIRPPVEMRRDDDAWHVTVAVPGLAPDKLDVKADARTLRICGERPAPAAADVAISELPYGQFERDITLPDAIDPKRVRAAYTNGMLELDLPLAEGTRRHRIEVQAAPVIQARNAA
ncbi:MAG: Hsp20/alpha crystallin family protein [Vicinamibacterales bacterium]